MKLPALTLGVISLLVAVAQAQTPAAPFDVTPIIRGLDAPASHDSTLLKLKAVPLEALVPLWHVALDKTTSAQVRIDLADAFPAIYTRLEADRKKREAAIDDAWTKANTLDAYNKVGHRDAKWDALAVAALSDVNPTPEALAKLKAAIDAGCDDPLVRYYYALRSLGAMPPRITTAEGIPLLHRTALQMDASKYPDGRKLYTYARFLNWSFVPSCPAEITDTMRRDALDRILALLPSIPAEKAGDIHMRELVDISHTAALKLYPGAQPSNDKLIPPITAAFPNSYIIDQINVAFLTNFAWEARGNGYASTVSPEQFQMFGDRLNQAEETGRHGWELNPLLDKCATSMIIVCMGQSRDQATMDSWFQRAILANPDSVEACSAKLQYLLPKWHGSEEEALAFGRECVQMGNARNRIPRVLITAVVELRTTAADADAYMAQPGVWKDLKSVYDKLLADKNDLKTDPVNYRVNRAEYIKYAAECQQWQALLDLMKEFGTDYDVTTLGGPGLYDFYKQKATTELQKKPI